MSTSLHFWFSQKSDLCTLYQHSQFLSRARVNRAYKRKFPKVQRLNLNLSDGYKPDGSDAWRMNVITKKIPILDSTDKYTHWLILKFTPIAKRSRLPPKRLGKIIIGDGMTA